MGMQIVQQPDGRFAVFSSCSDTLCMVDATEEEVIEYFADIARQREEVMIKVILDRIKTTGNAYYQFTRTWKEVVSTHKRNRNNVGDEEFAALVDEVIARNNTPKKEKTS